MSDTDEPGVPAPLPPEALYVVCDPSHLPFETTAELEPIDTVIGQDRAVEAIRFAIGMDHEGYNLFALGEEGSGRYSVVHRYLHEAAAGAPVPSDWCYVHNFEELHRPSAVELPPGQGCAFREEMSRLIEDLQAAIPAAFENEEYRNRRSTIEEGFKEENESTFSALQKRAEERNLALIRTQMGLALAPVRDGEVVKPQDFQALPEDERQRIEADLEELQKELAETMRKVPQWEKSLREQLKELDREVTRYAVTHLIDEAKGRWQAHPPVNAYLDAVRDDVVGNASEFLPQEDGGQQGMQMLMAAAGQRGPRGPSFFRRYQVNVLVDNTRPVAGEEEGWETCVEGALAGAPVIYEDHPTQPNLIGRVEHMTQFGSLYTDFNLIKAGALHRANGGYLVLDARRLLTLPAVWDTLKRTLRAGRIRIESSAEELGFAAPVSLQPEAIPLSVKVVLLGDAQIYYLLSRLDPDFRELFKVAADFDDRMARDGGNVVQYARLLGSMARREDLLPLHRSGVARMEEHGARLAGDVERLSTHIGGLFDLLREADYWARKAEATAIAAEHVQKAIDAKIYRSDRLRDRVHEQITRDVVHIATGGEAVGQVNGLAVMQLDSFAFGKPSRISCRVRMGRGEVIDIEREVDLGGPLHAKGVMILSSYLASQFAHEAPLSLSASLVFEQSYGGVDGDSASSTELYAMLSAISGIPIRQSLAVTGSVDQNGRVQAIGGANEKIEGFFDICSARGLTGDQGVLIPASNVKHLMLRTDVVQACREGQFQVYPVSHVEEGIALLTGRPAGRALADGSYPVGSVFRSVARQLDIMRRKSRALALRDRGRRRDNGKDGER